MIALLLEKLPASIEVYGYEFKWKICYEQEITAWLIAYVPTTVLKKTIMKKTYFEKGRWYDKDAKISTNGCRWLIAAHIRELNDNYFFETALVELTAKLKQL